MPFKSESQRRFMWARHPQIARRWAREYPNQKNLPEHSSKKADFKELETLGGGSTMSFAEQVIDAFQCSAAALQLAEKAAEDKKIADKRYADMIPVVVDACVQFGRIDNTDEEKQALAKMLSTPEGALDVITKLAAQEPDVPTTEIGGQQVDANGRVVTGQTKRASFGSLDSPYVGRRTSEKPQSWQNFERGLGIG
jgi:hypothetical protein